MNNLKTLIICLLSLVILSGCTNMAIIHHPPAPEVKDTRPNGASVFYYDIDQDGETDLVTTWIIVKGKAKLLKYQWLKDLPNKKELLEKYKRFDAI